MMVLEQRVTCLLMFAKGWDEHGRGVNPPVPEAGVAPIDDVTSEHSRYGRRDYRTRAIRT